MGIEETALWKRQLQNPDLRKFDPEYHGHLALREKTKMDLRSDEALAVLREAVYDLAKAANKAPSLWGIREGKIYRFMFDNRGVWHGYPVLEKPPNLVLQQWRKKGKITNAEYTKILNLPNRGK